MPNKKINIFLLAVLSSSIIFYGGRVIIDAFAAPTDITAPTVENLTIYPLTVSTGSNFMITMTVVDDISNIQAANIILESPSGNNILHAESTSLSYSNTSTRTYTILMPSGSEVGIWKIRSIYLADESGNTRTLYFGNDIGYTFEVKTGTQNNQSTNPICTSFTYGNWWSCQADGTQLRAITSALPFGCIGGNPILKNNQCVYVNNCSAGNTTTNINNCTWSAGVWDPNTCNCVCSTDYHFEGTSCVYTRSCTADDYNPWEPLQCPVEGGTQIRTLRSDVTCKETSSIPTSQTCSAVKYCTADNYDPWLPCDSTTRTQTRHLKSGITCTATTSVPTTQSCPACTTTEYSSWSPCPTYGGTQTRTVPTTCYATLPLSQACPVCLITAYSDWSTCSPTTRTQTRTVPTTCYATLPLSQTCLITNDTIDMASTTYCTIANYSDWSPCDSVTKTQTRHLISNLTCTATSTIPTTQSCTATVAPQACTAANYSSTWSPCQSDNTQTKSLLPTANCSGPATISQWCEYSYCNTNYLLNNQNKNSCEGSEGSWNGATCVCTCSANHYLNGAVCEYTNTPCTGFEYSGWSSCIGGVQKQTITKKIPDNCSGGFSPEPLEKQCIVLPTCIKDEWTCGEWGDCLNGTQKRTCSVSYDCDYIVTENPYKTEQTCTPQTFDHIYCKYTYTPWGDCIKGMQYREIESRSPDGCENVETESLSKMCDSSTSCQFTYSDWGSCINGKTTRTVISKYPTTCTDSPVLEDTCISTQVPQECINIGWNNLSDCELYMYKEKVLSDCNYKNLTTFDACREYILTYGKPSKCNDISELACDNLINDFVLSGFKDTISVVSKEQLSSVVGTTGTIDAQQGTITVQVQPIVSGDPVESREIKVEEMPLATSNTDQISVSLISTSSTLSQNNLSPVGITFDADEDGLPDDVEKRIGTDPNKKDTDGDGINDNEELKNGTSPLDPLATSTVIVLSGFDKAVVEGKTLEQPKFSNSTISETLTVNSVESTSPTGKNNLKLQGKAEPNKIVTLFIYSVMPIVVTVQSDSNGNWVYELDKTLVDGTHEAYVAINDDEGKIIETSLPTPFFIAQAQAVTVDNFISTGDASQVFDKTSGMIILYILGGLIVIFIFIAGILIIRQKYSE